MLSWRTRQRLFFILAAVFVILGGGIILYSQGWRLDLTTFRTEKVGAIFVRSFPPEAAITLNEAPIKNSSWLLQRGTLINGLFPKDYRLTLTRAGLRDWQETLEVKPSLVTEVKYAVLVPERDAATEVNASSTVKNFWLAGGRVILQDEKLKLFWQQNTATPAVPFAEGNVTAWTKNADALLITDKTSRTESIYRADTATSTPLNSLFKKAGLTPATGQTVILDPEDSAKLLIREKHRLRALDTARASAITLEDLTVPSSTKNEKPSPRTLGETVAASRFLWAWSVFNPQANTSTFVLYDKIIRVRQTGDFTLPGRNVKISFVRSDQLAILQDSNDLYLYNVASGVSRSVANDVRDFVFSADGNTVAALEHKSLEVFSFENTEKNYWRLPLPHIANVTDIRWFQDDQHLFILYPNKTRFLDLNDRRLENFPVVVETAAAQYDAENNLLYFLEKSRLWRMKFPG